MGDGTSDFDVFLNGQTGTFQVPQAFGVGISPVTFQITDVAGDGPSRSLQCPHRQDRGDVEPDQEINALDMLVTSRLGLCLEAPVVAKFSFCNGALTENAT